MKFISLKNNSDVLERMKKKRQKIREKNARDSDQKSSQNSESEDISFSQRPLKKNSPKSKIIEAIIPKRNEDLNDSIPEVRFTFIFFVIKVNNFCVFSLRMIKRMKMTCKQI